MSVVLSITALSDSNEVTDIIDDRVDARDGEGSNE
jgi:hypothetical protein